MKRFCCVMLFLCLYASGQCQTVTVIGIGAKLPAITISNIINSGRKNLNTGSLKKLVILDFMTTTCVSCIKALPRLDSLQKLYPEQLQIIVVTPEKAAKVKVFLQKHPYQHLAFATENTTLKKLFPHEYVSHIVWIDEAKTVRAITYSEYVTEPNIGRMLRGDATKWPVKKDAPEFDFAKPLLVADPNNMPAFETVPRVQYTAILPHLPGVMKYFKMVTDSSRGLQSIKLINYSLLDMYRLLLDRTRLPVTHVFFEGIDAQPFLYEEGKEFFDEWKSTHVYAVEAVTRADQTPTAVKQHLLSQLDFYFKLRVRLEKRKTNCWVLRNIASPENFQTITGDSMRVPQLVYLLNNRAGELPVVDESKGTVMMMLPLKKADARPGDHLTNILKACGLELVTEEREVEVMVVGKGL